MKAAGCTGLSAVWLGFAGGLGQVDHGGIRRAWSGEPGAQSEIDRAAGDLRPTQLRVPR